jgi:hypothetical protein
VLFYFRRERERMGVVIAYVHGGYGGGGCINDNRFLKFTHKHALHRLSYIYDNHPLFSVKSERSINIYSAHMSYLSQVIMKTSFRNFRNT